MPASHHATAPRVTDADTVGDIVGDARAIDRVWSRVRADAFCVEALIERCLPGPAPAVVEVTHLRSAHYSTWRVATADGDYLLRIGARTPDPPVENTGPHGTASTQPRGQRREVALAAHLHSAGVPVTRPVAVSDVDEYDVSWWTYEHAADPLILDTEAWLRLLRPLWATPLTTLGSVPRFTNWAKSRDRLTEIHALAARSGTADQAAHAEELGREYQARLQELCHVATRWSLVHGDAHAGNVVGSTRGPLLCDFDTTCLAPTVWDLTHLLARAGSVGNDRYDPEQLRRSSGFADTEVHAAIALRQVASRIAQLHRTARNTATPGPR